MHFELSASDRVTEWLGPNSLSVVHIGQVAAMDS